MNIKTLNRILLCSLMFFSPVLAEDESEQVNYDDEIMLINETDETEQKQTTNNTDNLVFSCRSSVRIYNNTKETITIYNGPDTDDIPSGSYSYTYGECGTNVVYKAEGTFLSKGGTSKVCSVNSNGELMYPETEDDYKDISITSLCGDATSIEINSLSNVSDKGLSKVATADSPEEYIYGLQISAVYENIPLSGIQFTVIRNGEITKDVFGNETIASTDSSGKVYFYLYAGYTYTVEQSDTNEKYSIANGEITIDSTNASVSEADGFKIADIEEYTKITFKNGLSDKELQILSNTESQNAALQEWKEEQINKINEIYNSIDFSKYNNKQLIKLKTIKEEELTSLDDIVKQYALQTEQNIRNEDEVNYSYSLENFRQKLNITPHWQHWLIVIVIVLASVLHFIFNKHLLIDLIILLGGSVLFLDYCKTSLILLVILIVICLIFTVLGWRMDDGYEEIDESHI